MSRGTEKTTVWFAKTDVSRLEEFNQVTQLIVSNSRITVAVSEGVTEANGSVIYEFDSLLNLLSTSLSESLQRRITELQRSNTIRTETFERILTRLTGQLQIINHNK